ncbi:MAG: LysM domain-containing protein [Proteobacteria bacterium]|nr:LysM domain-containing protein [Pseudomonadota bacterium]
MKIFHFGVICVSLYALSFWIEDMVAVRAQNDNYYNYNSEYGQGYENYYSQDGEYNNNNSNYNNNYNNNNSSSNAQGSEPSYDYSPNLQPSNNQGGGEYSNNSLMNNSNVYPGVETPGNEASASADASGDMAAKLKQHPQIKLDPIPLPNEFSGTPGVLDSLGILDVGEAPSYYTIQEGDTLFDICDQLLDDPDYWPKLWALNPEIRNPHYIWPGMVLRFYPGDEFLPPFLEIEDDEDLDPVNVASDYVVEDLLFVDLFDVPPEAPPRGFTLSNFVEWDDIQTPSVTAIGGYGSVGIVATQPFFVLESRLKDALAELKGIFTDSAAINPAGLLEADEPLQPGTTYSVLRYGEKVRHPRTNNTVGFRYLNIGVIRVDEYSEEEEEAIFSTVHQWGFFMVGDLVVPLRPSQHDMPLPSGMEGRDADATVIGFKASESTIAAENRFIILDSNAFNTGERVALYRRRTSSHSDRNIRGFGGVQRYGVVHVVDVGDETAIAYVLHAGYLVEPGDRTDENFD